MASKTARSSENQAGRFAKIEKSSLKTKKRKHMRVLNAPEWTEAMDKDGRHAGYRHTLMDIAGRPDRADGGRIFFPFDDLIADISEYRKPSRDLSGCRDGRRRSEGCQWSPFSPTNIHMLLFVKPFSLLIFTSYAIALGASSCSSSRLNLPSFTISPW